jgi:hypothetical protein|tara:strand:+ start:2711 stop:2938 length:228 start_codon:yes stop_codon:yes gene_type:complete
MTDHEEKMNLDRGMDDALAKDDWVPPECADLSAEELAWMRKNLAKTKKLVDSVFERPQSAPEVVNAPKGLKNRGK